MRKNIAFFLCFVIIMALVGCGAESQSHVADDTTEQEEVSTSEATETTAEDTGSSENDESDQDNEKTVASDGATIQTDDPDMATRVIENGTEINMYFTNTQTGEETVITGILNDSETAKALIEQLPYTVSVSRYSHDFCGITEELPYQESEVHYGWLNGDIDYATNAPYFTILFDDEENSEQYGYQVNIGVVTCPLSEISALQGSYEIRIELAKESS